MIFFSPVISSEVLLLIFLLILIGVFFSFNKFKRNKFSLLVLRILLFTFLFFLFLSPTKKIRKKSIDKPLHIFLVDTSKSVKENFPLIKDFIKKIFHSNLKNKFRAKLYTFSSTAKKVSIDSFLAVGPLGERTDIASSIENIIDRENRVASIILISDGAQNTDKNPISIAKHCNFSIYSIAVKRIKKDYTNLKIEGLHLSNIAFLNTSFSFKVTIKANGFKNSSIPVILKKGETIIQQHNVKFDNDMDEKELKFSFIPKEKGNFIYTVSIPVYKDERLKNDNIKRFLLKVVRDRIRILYITGRPSWETRFLRYFLKHNPNIDLVMFMILRNPDDISIVSENRLALIPFPVSTLFTRDLFDFDIFIMENFSYRRFNIPIAYLENIKRFVDNGGGFLMIGGENSFSLGGYKNTPLEEILPVTLLEDENIIDKNFKIKIRNYNHPITRLKFSLEQTIDLWERASSLYGLNTLGLPKKNAIVLAQYNNIERYPIVAVSNYGKGRTMIVASPTTWKWIFSHNNIYNLFWENTVLWLAGSGQFNTVKIYKNKEEYKLGEKVRIKVELFNQYYKKQHTVNIEVLLTEPNGKKVLLTRKKQLEKEELLYDFLPEHSGVYFVNVKVIQKDGNISKGEISFKVKGFSSEDEEPPNHQLLKDIAEVSGGEFFYLKDIKDINFILKNKEESLFEKKIILYHPLFYLLIILILVGEWCLRTWGRKKQIKG